MSGRKQRPLGSEVRVEVRRVEFDSRWGFGIVVDVRVGEDRDAPLVLVEERPFRTFVQGVRAQRIDERRRSAIDPERCSADGVKSPRKRYVSVEHLSEPVPREWYGAGGTVLNLAW